MRPAFSSTRQAAAFALLLLGLLLAPALASKRILPPRETIYSSIWWGSGDFPYMDGQIFGDTNAMDIAFLGSSHIWAAFDTPSVQEQLGKQLGRPATVRTFGWGGAGYDELYFVAEDLLAHHKVRMLVFDDEYDASDQPHILASKMFRYGDDAYVLDGLPMSLKASYYFASIAGIPRNVLSMSRPNLPADMNATNYWESRSHAQNFAAMLGMFTAHIGFKDNPGVEPGPFVTYAPATDVQPSDVCVYSPDTKTNFVFSSHDLPPGQFFFEYMLNILADQCGCKLVILHVPMYDERRSPVISMPKYWPDNLWTNVPRLGIPPATLFRGLSDTDIRKLYSDHVHLNENGQEYFTRLMTPALLKIYESQIQSP